MRCLLRHLSLVVLLTCIESALASTDRAATRQSSAESFHVVEITPDALYQRAGSAVTFRQVTPSLALPQKDGKNLPLGGQTWAIAWGDADNNLYPDLYLNHHTRRSTRRPEVPFSHLLFNPGAPEADGAYADLDGVDQHAAIFIDINGDGQQDIYELQGGRQGKSTASSRGTSNRVLLGEDGAFSSFNSADDFHLGYSQGRGRNVTPLNVNGSLGLLVQNKPREDGMFPTMLFVRNSEGTFEQRPEKFVEKKTCSRRSTAEKPCAAAANADLNHVLLAIPGYFDADEYLDVILLGSRSAGKYPVELFTGNDEGDFAASSTPGPGVVAHDGAVLDADNDGRFDLWLTGKSSGRRKQGTGNSLYTFSPGGEFVKQPLEGMIPFLKLMSASVVSGDFDNDGDEDVVTYEADRKTRGTDKSSQFMFSLWENDGEGRFLRTLFTDPENDGFPRSVALADYNLDGSLDLLFGDGSGHRGVWGVGGYILIEGVPNGNHWLQLDIGDPWSLRGLGARVYVTAGERTMLRGVFGGVHEAAQNHERLHFGLGRHKKASIRVLWPDGTSTEIKDIAVDRVLKIEYPGDRTPQKEPG